MVGEAQRSRAPIQRVADAVAAYFVPAVVLAAAVTFIAWAWLSPKQPALAYAFVNAVAVLIIACPCALGLATPMSIMVGVGRGAKEGVLIKDAATLERMEKVDTVVVDKTGTLTEGRPRLTETVPAAANLRVGVVGTCRFHRAEQRAPAGSRDRAGCPRSQHRLAARRRLRLRYGRRGSRPTLMDAQCWSVNGPSWRKTT